MVKIIMLLIGVLWIGSGCESSYSVEFDTGNGEPMESQTFSSGETLTLEAPQKEDAYFLGWERSGDSTLYGAADTVEVTEDMVFNAVYEPYEAVFSYTVIENADTRDTVRLDSYKGEQTSIDLPLSIEGYPVSRLASYMFEDSDVESVRVPKTVRHLANFPFSKAQSLREVFFYGEFGGEQKRVLPSDEVYAYLEDTSQCGDVDIDADITQKSFPDDCPILDVFKKTDTVTGPDGNLYYSYDVVVNVKHHYERADYRIGLDGFSASNVETIHLHERFGYIDPQAFKETPNLEDVHISKNNPYYQSVDGVLYDEESNNLHTLPGNKDIETLHMPSHIVGLMPGALSYNPNIHLQAIDVSGNDNLSMVDGILYDAMQSELIHYLHSKTTAHLDVPTTVEVIGPYAFSNHASLDSVTLPESLVLIRSSVFEGSNITSVRIASSVMQIEQDAFMDTDSLTSITFERDLTEESDIQIHRRMLDPSRDDITFYVPKESVDAYKTHDFFDHTGFKAYIEPIQGDE